MNAIEKAVEEWKIKKGYKAKFDRNENFRIKEKTFDELVVEINKVAVPKDVLREKINWCFDWITIGDGKKAQDNNLNVQVKLGGIVDLLERWEET